MNLHSSVPMSAPIEIIQMSEYEHSPLVSKCQIKVCYVGDEPNRNMSVITKDVAKDMASSLRGAMIVGKYNETKDDFEAHNEIIEVNDKGYTIKPGTVPYGFVDINAKVWFQKFFDDNQVEREYLVTEGYLWTGQYPECARVIKSGNGQSMELDGSMTRGTWAEDDNGFGGFFIINDAVISKLCLLGDDVEPCFEGASVTRADESGLRYSFKSDEDFMTKLYSLMNEMKELLSKGGEEAMDENIVIQEQEQIEMPAVETIEESGAAENFSETLDEIEQEVTEEIEDTVEQVYNLDDISEYQAALTRIAELEEENARKDATIAELQGNYSTLLEESNELRQFKATIVRADKEKMIDSFYMLSDEDKKDVVENIDNYSLEDIEAKLSIICVRNRVSFTKDESQPAMTYSVDSTIDNTPSWIKAVQEVEKEM